MSTVITKRDLIESISRELKISQNKVAGVIQSFMQQVTFHLAQGDEVVLRRFGSFHPRIARRKVGRNPNQPGLEVIIPSRVVVKFKPGNGMREAVSHLMAPPQPADQRKCDCPQLATT